MSSRTGFHPAGTLGYCAYNITDTVTVNVGQEVNVNFTGGTPPFTLRRVNNNGITVQCNAPYLNGEIIPPTIDSRSFTWTVEDPQTSTTSYPNGTTGNTTYGAKGDQTYFIVTQQTSTNSTEWKNEETQYWTSHKFIIGDDTPVSHASPRIPRNVGVGKAILFGLLFSGAAVISTFV